MKKHKVISIRPSGSVCMVNTDGTIKTFHQSLDSSIESVLDTYVNSGWEFLNVLKDDTTGYKIILVKEM